MSALKRWINNRFTLKLLPSDSHTIAETSWFVNKRSDGHMKYSTAIELRFWVSTIDYATIENKLSEFYVWLRLAMADSKESSIRERINEVKQFIYFNSWLISANTISIVKYCYVAAHHECFSFNAICKSLPADECNQRSRMLENKLNTYIERAVSVKRELRMLQNELHATKWFINIWKNVFWYLFRINWKSNSTSETTFCLSTRFFSDPEGNL